MSAIPKIITFCFLGLNKMHPQILVTKNGQKATKSAPNRDFRDPNWPPIWTLFRPWETTWPPWLTLWSCRVSQTPKSHQNRAPDPSKMSLFCRFSSQNVDFLDNGQL